MTQQWARGPTLCRGICSLRQRFDPLSCHRHVRQSAVESVVRAILAFRAHHAFEHRHLARSAPAPLTHPAILGSGPFGILNTMGERSITRLGLCHHIHSMPLRISRLLVGRILSWAPEITTGRLQKCPHRHKQWHDTDLLVLSRPFLACMCLFIERCSMWNGATAYQYCTG